MARRTSKNSPAGTTPGPQPSADKTPAQGPAQPPVRGQEPRPARPEGTAARPSAEVEPARPSSDQIRARAYRLFVERGGSPGQELADWLRAERELIEELRRVR